MLQFDHLMWGAASLEQGIEAAAELFGVNAAPGGAHSGLGTCNALLSLGKSQYLEIIAPDPAQQADSPFVAGLKALPDPALVTWAVASSDLSETAQRARSAGLDCRGPVATERRTPAGDTLAWQLLYLVGHGHRGLMPFAIDWQRSRHPATTNPSAGQFQRLQIGSPHADELTKLFATLGIEADVVESPEPTLTVEITTSNGLVRLESTTASLGLLS